MIVPGLSKHLLLDFVRSLGDADCHFALLRSDAQLGPESGYFDGTGEIRAQGYAAGGKKLQNFACGLDNGIAWASWGNPEWLNASIKASGGVIYAKKQNNRIVTVLDFGEEKTSSQGLFRIRMPAPGPTNAVVWMA